MTRVGFIGPANAVVPITDPALTGFEITVETDQVDLTATPLTIANIAQAFGSGAADDPLTDRKSTRLNSSHTVISYAVFCLKKKKNKINKFIFAYSA